MVHSTPLKIGLVDFVSVEDTNFILDDIRSVAGVRTFCVFCDFFVASVWHRAKLGSLSIQVPILRFASENQAGLLNQELEELALRLVTACLQPVAIKRCLPVSNFYTRACDRGGSQFHADQAATRRDDSSTR